MIYSPGLHIISTLESNNQLSLQKFESLKPLLDKLITECELNKLGEVYHNFLPAGFTGIICLSESHISMHTWPEFGRVNLDIYLSNYNNQNDKKGEVIYKALRHYFTGIIINEQFIRR